MALLSLPTILVKELSFKWIQLNIIQMLHIFNHTFYKNHICSSEIGLSMNFVFMYLLYFFTKNLEKISKISFSTYHITNVYCWH